MSFATFCSSPERRLSRQIPLKRPIDLPKPALRGFAAVVAGAGCAGKTGIEALPSLFASAWYGTGQFGNARSAVEAELAGHPGKQLAIVNYSPVHSSLDEWVYNRADIEHAKVIWARQMNEAENAELMRFYPDRTVWLVEPDVPGTPISAYPVSSRPAAP